MHSNDELLGTLCGKTQDAALVWIINILLHSLACILRVIARVGVVFSRAVHANLYNKVYLSLARENDYVKFNFFLGFVNQSNVLEKDIH